jgi:hypothetical protein
MRGEGKRQRQTGGNRQRGKDRENRRRGRDRAVSKRQETGEKR